MSRSLIYKENILVSGQSLSSKTERFDLLHNMPQSTLVYKKSVSSYLDSRISLWKLSAAVGQGSASSLVGSDLVKI